jgi:hypothetical protein
METDYNIQPNEKTIFMTLGDPLDKTYSVKKNGVLSPIAGMQLDVLIKDSLGNTVKTLSSAGILPQITISTSYFNILISAFTAGGIYNADIQLTEGSKVSTIGKWTFIVEPQITS